MARKLIALLIAAWATLFAAPGHAKTLHPDTPFIRGHIGQYDEWLTGCDNRANCTIIGIPGRIDVADAEVAPIDPAKVDDMIVRIYWAADNVGTPQVELLPLTHRGDSQFYLVGWDELGRISPFHDYKRLTLDEYEASMLISQLSTHAAIYGYAAADGATRLRFASYGFSRAYKATIRRREILRGEVKAGKSVQTLPGEELMLPSVTSLYRQRSGCHVPNKGVSLRRYRLSNEEELWRLQCSDEPSAPSYWYHSGADGIGQPLSLPDPRDRSVAAGDTGLLDAVFDFDTGVLRSYLYPQGDAGCGIFRAWGWTDKGWQLLERREMPVCAGLSPADWIGTYKQDAIIGLSGYE